VETVKTIIGERQDMIGAGDLLKGIVRESELKKVGYLVFDKTQG
jgi:hypothetical protein